MLRNGTATDVWKCGSTGFGFCANGAQVAMVSEIGVSGPQSAWPSGVCAACKAEITATAIAATVNSTASRNLPDRPSCFCFVTFL